MRKDIANQIIGASLVPRDLSKTRITYTKVSPGGEFKKHVDDYHHVLLFLHGNGLLVIGEREYVIENGTVAEIPAGVVHGYKNTGDELLTLITINVPT